MYSSLRAPFIFSSRPGTAFCHLGLGFHFDPTWDFIFSSWPGLYFVIPTERLRPVIPTERSEWRDLVHIANQP